MSDSIALPARRAAPIGEALAGLLLTAPAALAYALMLLLPTLAAVALAFTDYELGMPGFAWIGLDNFAELLGDLDVLLVRAITPRWRAR